MSGVLFKIKGIIGSNKMESHFGLFEGEDRHEVMLDIETEPNDCIHSPKGTYIKAIYRADTKEVIGHYFHEKETERYIKFSFTEEEEKMVTEYLNENFPTEVKTGTSPNEKVSLSEFTCGEIKVSLELRKGNYYEFFLSNKIRDIHSGEYIPSHTSTTPEEVATALLDNFNRTFDLEEMIERDNSGEYVFKAV